MSRCAGFFAERHVDRWVLAAKVLDAMRPAYAVCGRSDALEARFFARSRTMLPTSDFYFLATAAQKLRVASGPFRLERDAVEVGGERLPCDVLIQCIGFTPDKALDQALRPDLKQGGRVVSFHNGNGATRRSPTAPFAGCAGGSRYLAPCYAFFAEVEALPAADLIASERALRRRVAARVRRTPLDIFLAEQQDEWARYCALLGVDVEYPYRLEDLLAWEKALQALKPLAQKTEGTPFNTLDSD